MQFFKDAASAANSTTGKRIIIRRSAVYNLVDRIDCLLDARSTSINRELDILMGIVPGSFADCLNRSLNGDNSISHFEAIPQTERKLRQFFA